MRESKKKLICPGTPEWVRHDNVEPTGLELLRYHTRFAKTQWEAECTLQSRFGEGLLSRAEYDRAIEAIPSLKSQHPH